MKTERINIKVSKKFKQGVKSDAANLGFLQRNGSPNFSQFVRWILRNGNKPIDRDQYDELIRLNINLIKMMTLFNQYLYHLNRERKVLLDQGIEGNNKHFLKSIEIQKIEIDEIKGILLEIQKITQKIYILENA